MVDVVSRAVRCAGGAAKAVRSGAAATAGLAALFSAAPCAAGQAELTIAQGRLAGRDLKGGGTEFAGIPYAAPPVGRLRWRAPNAALPWKGVRDATRPGPTCMQPDLGWNAWDAARGAEDCLTLNVWKPASGRRLPVMVWFHGGAFLGGSGSAPTYDGAALIRDGVVVVTVNYRLGVLGFLAHPGLSAESPDRVSGNYGTMDQIAALAWVRANVARFGGDPANVTIFGQSAGSISVADLAAIPRARSLFRRAIMESGTPFGVGELPTREDAERGSAGFGDVAALRAEPAPALVARWASWSAAAPATRRAIPVVDGRLIERQPAQEYLAGAVRDLPILLGSNVREIPPGGREDLLAAGRRLLGRDPADVVAAYERSGTDPLAGPPATRMMTDMLFRCGTLATAGVARGARLYHFLEDFPGRGAPAHSAEVFYVFDSAATASGGKGGVLTAEQQALGRTMRRYWTNFARTGDPNGSGLPLWPAFSSGAAYMELSAKGPRPRGDLGDGFCRPFLERWRASASTPATGAPQGGAGG